MSAVRERIILLCPEGVLDPRFYSYPVPESAFNKVPEPGDFVRKKDFKEDYWKSKEISKFFGERDHLKVAAVGAAVIPFEPPSPTEMSVSVASSSTPPCKTRSIKGSKK